MPERVLVLGGAGMLGRPVMDHLTEMGHEVRALFRRVVAASYRDDSALGKRLFVHGPEGITLPNASERFFAACHPQLKVRRMRLWKAQLIAKLVRSERLAYVASLIDFFDKVGELGDCTEADALFGAPSITLEEWFNLQQDSCLGVGG